MRDYATAAVKTWREGPEAQTGEKGKERLQGTNEDEPNGCSRALAPRQSLVRVAEADLIGAMVTEAAVTGIRE